jgi:hypothetical protein
MAEFKKGAAAIKETADAKGSRKFTPNIYWKEGDARTLAFITPIDEVPRIKIHQMVQIPDDTKEKGHKWESFLCQKDPTMVEAYGGKCVLCDTIGHKATDRFAALAVELKPVKQGKEIVSWEVEYSKFTRQDGTEVEIPRWGLVLQGAKNFFSYLAAYDETKGDITKLGWEIVREGGGVGTKYHMYPEKGVSLPDFADLELPDLDDLLRDMGTAEHYNSNLSEVEPGSQPSFGNDAPNPVAPSSSDDKAAKFAELEARLAANATSESEPIASY